MAENEGIEEVDEESIARTRAAERQTTGESIIAFVQEELSYVPESEREHIRQLTQDFLLAYLNTRGNKINLEIARSGIAREERFRKLPCRIKAMVGDSVETLFRRRDYDYVEDDFSKLRAYVFGLSRSDERQTHQYT